MTPSRATPEAGSARSRTVRVKAPGKINVSFSVGPLRPDGYHSVASVYLAVSLYEEVAASTTNDGEITVSLRKGSLAQEMPLDESNLAVRAARLMAELSEQPSGVHLEITKRVPIAGGMGGGSADAAATLLACDALWNAGLSREELAHLAAELGADVPFSLLGGAAIGLGVGDQLTPALAPNPLHWTLVLPDFGLSTPTVFAALDRIRIASGFEPAEPEQIDPAVLRALRAGDAEALADTLHNDLQPAATRLAPQLVDVLEQGSEYGALSTIVSGSGPTVAMLASSESHALELVDRLAEAGQHALAVHSPVHGAKIVSDLIH
ncbi:4-(cytidine 5'-diphospho)-2-C-methyl-D-erythritol kinase [Psychromicrobium lacuslunae]|uniref:4-diphosphocytidyl-2-C-methyl-D-erythritol kinase n=1 Tax=Psychromicrobium lacuslunae TaxID=1618207 RepID=A0A0D4BWD2_9MICC|nr:4-(cytidine 5'-diphospho)-2-C-methyl-D-erythritol kinase [Psychromicrobium lacuslunae]AJT40436.1 4-diphosphocytidyl-2C-methyl-D-erythritol kinase [Psychromicrobium lacuslunae]